MIVDPILLAGPSITHREIECAADAAAVGWNMREAGYIQTLQTMMTRLSGQQHAFATSSRTGALHLAMVALGIKAGDEVLVPEIADVSAAWCVVYTGAKPVFCDVDPRSLCLDPASARAKVTEKTRAVVPVHLFGQPCDMEGIMALARERNLAVVEDATQGMGARVGDQPAGSFGIFSAFSFNSREAVACGQGGMLLSPDPKLLARAMKRGRRGRNSENPNVYDEVGFNYAMSNMQASLVVPQLERLEELLARKKQIASWYRERLDGMEGVRLNPDIPGTDPSFLMTILLLEDKSIVRTDFLRRLRASNVLCAPVPYPLSSMPVFSRADNPVAYGKGARALLLPSGHNRTEEEIEYVTDTVKVLLADRTLRRATVYPTGWLAYKSEVLETIARAKSDGLVIPFGHGGEDYVLRALTAAEAQKPETIRFMGDFRRENMHVFLHRHEVTDEFMRTAMEHYTQRARDFLLFFVARLTPKGEGKLFGHMGLDDFNFQKHECVAEGFMMLPDSPKGLAAAAAGVMYAWAKETLAIRRVFNHVVGSNKKVRLLAAAQGFREVNKTSLYRQDLPNGKVVFRPMYILGHDQPEEYFVFSVKDL